MFGELPKIFDRNFAIGYFLPIAVFIAVSFGVLSEFGHLSKLLPYLQANILIGTTVAVLASWLGGILLLTLNLYIFRLMEGYGRLNPARLLAWIERLRYKRLLRIVTELNKEYKSCDSTGKEILPELQNKRIRYMQELAERFPDQECWLLPTAFGNTIRAFEVYPRVMYGIESIQGWNRLLAVIPKEYRELVDTAKAQTDFWVNLWVLSFLTVLEYIILCMVTHQFIMFLLPIVTLAFTLIASSRARHSAIEWGELVKASFDIFLPELGKKLGFIPPTSREQERDLWIKFSQSIIYRLPDGMPSLSSSSTSPPNSCPEKIDPGPSS